MEGSAQGYPHLHASSRPFLCVCMQMKEHAWVDFLTKEKKINMNKNILNGFEPEFNHRSHSAIKLIKLTNLLTKANMLYS